MWTSSWTYPLRKADPDQYYSAPARILRPRDHPRSRTGSPNSSLASREQTDVPAASRGLERVAPGRINCRVAAAARDRIHPLLPPSTEGRLARALRRNVCSCRSSRVQWLGSRSIRSPRFDLQPVRDAEAGRLGANGPRLAVRAHRGGPDGPGHGLAQPPGRRPTGPAGGATRRTTLPPLRKGNALISAPAKMSTYVRTRNPTNTQSRI